MSEDHIREAFDAFGPSDEAKDRMFANILQALEEEPETVKAFLDATRRGYEYAVENPYEAADLLIEGDTTGSLKGSEELVYASQEWLAGKYIDDAEQWGVIDPERWDAFYGWLYENGLTKHDLCGMGYTNEYLG